MPQFSAIGRSGFLRPTEAQLRTNIFVVPKAFINRYRQRLRWFHGFDVLIGNERFANRKIDLENRIGGVALRNHFRFGQLLKLEIVDGSTLRIRTAEESEIVAAASGDNNDSRTDDIAAPK